MPCGPGQRLPLGREGGEGPEGGARRLVARPGEQRDRRRETGQVTQHLVGVGRALDEHGVRIELVEGPIYKL